MNKDYNEKLLEQALKGCEEMEEMGEMEENYDLTEYGEELRDDPEMLNIILKCMDFRFYCCDQLTAKREGGDWFSVQTERNACLNELVNYLNSLM